METGKENERAGCSQILGLPFCCPTSMFSATAERILLCQQQNFYSLAETKTHTRVVTKGETKCCLSACCELRNFTSKPFPQVLEVCLWFTKHGQVEVTGGTEFLLHMHGKVQLLIPQCQTLP